ncbi:MAG: glycosyltransferase family 2 protein [Planctomycetota bacterium]
MPSAAPPRTSVVLCTRNRAASLAAACRVLLAMDHPPERWELLVVDNASTDDTLEVARVVARAHPGRVRVIEERRLGLSAARNAAVGASEAELLAFLDDDAEPVPGWLASLEAALGRDGVWAAGGPVIPVFAGELPDWFAGRFLPYLSVWDRGDECVPLAYNDYPRGTNIAFRRDVFARFGPFSLRLGRRGRSLRSGEEIELCLRIERHGGQVLYVPGAAVRHATPLARLTPSWMARRFQAQGRSEAIIDWRHAGLRGLRHGLRRAARHALAARVERRFGRPAAVLARCQRRALLGYARGLVEAAASIRRYRPPADPPARAWRPFAEPEVPENEMTQVSVGR